MKKLITPFFLITITFLSLKAQTSKDLDTINVYQISYRGISFITSEEELLNKLPPPDSVQKIHDYVSYYFNGAKYGGYPYKFLRLSKIDFRKNKDIIIQHPLISFQEIQP